MTSWRPDLRVRCAGRDWTLLRPADFDSLWEDMVADGRADADEHIPYWTELWPSSVVLADWLRANSDLLRGALCVDTGCGLGLTARVAASLGARVVAFDYEPEALVFAREGFAADGDDPAAEPLWLAMDWRRPALPRGCADLVWGGDIMYERRFVDPVLRFFSHVLAPGGRVWVAEPGRDIYDHFLRALDGFGWTGRKVHEASVDALYAQAVPVRVGIWELTRRP